MWGARTNILEACPPKYKFDKKKSIIDIFALLPAIYLKKVLQIILTSLYTPGRLWEKSAPNYRVKFGKIYT